MKMQEMKNASKGFENAVTGNQRSANQRLDQRLRNCNLKFKQNMKAEQRRVGQRG